MRRGGGESDSGIASEGRLCRSLRRKPRRYLWILTAVLSPTIALGDAPPIVLPLTFGEHQLVYVPAELGCERLRLNVDLGSSATLTLPSRDLDAALASGLARSRPDTRRTMDVRGNVIASRTFETSALRLDGQSVAAIVGHEARYAPDYAPPERTGVLGHGFLRRYRVVIDYAAARLTLLDPKSGRWPTECRASTTRKLRFLDADGVAVRASLDSQRQPRRLIFDTGASVSALKPAAVPVPDDGKAASRSQYVSSRTIIAGHDLGAVRFQIFDMPGLPADGLLGSDVFHANVVCIDFRSAQLRITPRAQTGAAQSHSITSHTGQRLDPS